MLTIILIACGILAILWIALAFVLWRWILHPNVRVFLSYRRDDTGDMTHLLYEKLAGVLGESQVFMDIQEDEPEKPKIRPGTHWLSTIKQEVYRSHVMLVMIGGNYLELKDEHGNRRIDNPEDVVRKEIEEALQLDKSVFPVLVNIDSFPQGLPESINRLSSPEAFRNPNKTYFSGHRR